MLSSTGKNRPMTAVGEGVLVHGVNESGGPGVVLVRDADKRVVVELSGTPFGLECRRLGSLTERYGMPMQVTQPLNGRARASIGVPRAKTQQEAEATVAALLARIRLRAPR